jgi:DNA repair exonuclease SbcCD nuclease subunit
VVDKIFEIKPDFVIHSGDLFEFSRPPTKALLEVQKNFLRLKEKGIVIYAIPGNHDVVMKKNTLPPHILFKNLNLKLIGPRNPYFIHDGIFIGGSPYRSKYYSRLLKEQIDTLAKKAEKYKKRILVLHQAIDKYLPFEFELKIGDIPKSFDYYAFGHIHKRILEDFGRGKLGYAGSTELWKIDEYRSYKQKGKGFYIVDLDGDSPVVEEVNIELPREIIKEKIPIFELDQQILKLTESIKSMSNKPLLHLEIVGETFDIPSVHEKLLRNFSDIVLSVRPKYSLEKTEEEARIKIKSLDIRDLINESFKKNSERAEFVYSLFELLSLDNEEEAKKITEELYGRFK